MSVYTCWFWFPHKISNINVAVVFLSAACEKFALHQQVLSYTEAGLQTDLLKAGTSLATNRVLLLSQQGRAHAALGQASAAASNFLAAAQQARQSGYRLLEAYALRDAISMGEIQEEDRARTQLREALHLLKGPRTALLDRMTTVESHDLFVDETYIALPNEEPSDGLTVTASTEDRITPVGDEGKPPVDPEREICDLEVQGAGDEIFNGFYIISEDDGCFTHLEHEEIVLKCTTASPAWTFYIGEDPCYYHPFHTQQASVAAFVCEIDEGICSAEGWMVCGGGAEPPPTVLSLSGHSIS